MLISIGNLKVPKTLTVKKELRVKFFSRENEIHLHENLRNDPHINGFTLTLALKQRLGATRKRPVVLKVILRLRSLPGSFPTRP